MRQQWQQMLQKFNALNRRERVMVFVAMLSLVLFVVNHFYFDPLMVEHKKVKTQLEDDRKKLALYVQQLQQLSATEIPDPDAVSRQQLQALTVQQTQLDVELKQMQDTLVSPDQMAGVLEEVLRSNQQLKLVRVKTLDLEEIDIAALASPTQVSAPNVPSEQTVTDDAASQPPQTEQKALIYQHGVEFVVAGGYFELLSALKKVEALPWNLRWGKISLDSGQYPEAKLTVTVYTLSVDKAWLSL